MMNPLGERVYEYRAVKIVAGVKVLKSIHPKRQPDLPMMSNSPNSKYVVLDKDGNYIRQRNYGKNRLPVSDIDIHDVNGKISLHKNLYDKNGKRIKGHFDLTSADKRKYAKIIKALQAKN